MPDITDKCNRFYFVMSGDTCAGIAQKEKVGLPDFYSWNPAVGSSGLYLWQDAYVCVGVIGGKPTTAISSATPTTTT